MSLATAISQGPPPDARRYCAAGAWVHELNSEDRAAYDQAALSARAREGGWDTSKLWRVMVAEGFPMQRDNLRRHLSGECSCP